MIERRTNLFIYFLQSPMLNLKCACVTLKPFARRVTQSRLNNDMTKIEITNQ